MALTPVESKELEQLKARRELIQLKKRREELVSSKPEQIQESSIAATPMQQAPIQQSSTQMNVPQREQAIGQAQQQAVKNFASPITGIPERAKAFLDKPISSAFMAGAQATPILGTAINALKWFDWTGKTTKGIRDVINVATEREDVTPVRRNAEKVSSFIASEILDPTNIVLAGPKVGKEGAAVFKELVADPVVSGTKKAANFARRFLLHTSDSMYKHFNKVGSSGVFNPILQTEDFIVNNLVPKFVDNIKSAAGTAKGWGAAALNHLGVDKNAIKRLGVRGIENTQEALDDLIVAVPKKIQAGLGRIKNSASQIFDDITANAPEGEIIPVDKLMDSITSFTDDFTKTLSKDLPANIKKLQGTTGVQDQLGALMANASDSVKASIQGVMDDIGGSGKISIAKMRGIIQNLRKSIKGDVMDFDSAYNVGVIDKMNDVLKAHWPGYEGAAKAWRGFKESQRLASEIGVGFRDASLRAAEGIVAGARRAKDAMTGVIKNLNARLPNSHKIWDDILDIDALKKSANIRELTDPKKAEAYIRGVVNNVFGDNSTSVKEFMQFDNLLPSGKKLTDTVKSKAISSFFNGMREVRVSGPGRVPLLVPLRQIQGAALRGGTKAGQVLGQTLGPASQAMSGSGTRAGGLSTKLLLQKLLNSKRQ